MKTDWNRHRFSGGMLVLDLINTVVHRQKPAQAFDRFADPGSIPAFVAAAQVFRADEVLADGGYNATDKRSAERLVTLREAANLVFRPRKEESRIERADGADLHRLFDAAARISKPNAPGSQTDFFGLSCALSAMRLLGGADRKRIRACPNCDWLFLDRSRNGSRRWCDMAVCGNRAKAARHYRLKSGTGNGSKA